MIFDMRFWLRINLLNDCISKPVISGQTICGQNSLKSLLMALI